MTDEITIVMVVAGTLVVFVFMAVQLKVYRARRQHSLGDRYKQKARPGEQPPRLAKE